MYIYVSGYFYANLGDDLFVHILAQRYPKINFIIVTKNEYKESYINESNIKVVVLRKFDCIRSKLIELGLKCNTIYEKIKKKSNASILIGGSMFQELENDTNAIRRIDSFPGKYSDVYILGINFGPYRTQEYYEKVQNYLSISKDVCFRDEYSYNKFKQLHNVRYAKDIVFNIDKIVPKVRISDDKTLSISVMNFKSRDNLAMYVDSYENFIVRVIEYYSSLDYKINLISFSKMEGDELAIESILDKCKTKLKVKLNIIKYTGINWKEIVDVISSSDSIIATRFHSMILGFAYSIPTFPIIYNKKCQQVLEDLDSIDGGNNLCDLEKMDCEKLKFIKIKNIDEIKKESERQFDVLDELFGRNLNDK